MISFMVSSTVSDLEGERKCILDLFSQNSYIDIIGANPYNSSSISASSFTHTVSMAQECDLFILILGSKFGFELPDGRSATEAEYDSAYKSDPTKIIVFQKDVEITLIEAKQRIFIDKVCNYYSGYWRSTFKYTHELQAEVNSSCLNWLRERAAFNKNLTYLDHFVRLAVQRRPEPTALVYYKVTDSYVELEYRFLGKIRTIQFAKQKIYTDFWGCLFTLQNNFTSWI